MKAKYLFYSLALTGMFAACSQEELFDAPVQDSNDLAKRAVVGNVTFVGDEIESRYNSESATFQKGDKMGLYLMDEFDKSGENKNANTTPKQYQTRWWDMYDMVDYISTNFGYVYEGNGKWVNPATQLNEGNYIAMFPMNTRVTNRRDLWHPIKSNLDLVAHSSIARYYVNRENQFFVGYEQIMRDEDTKDAGGTLEAKIGMKPILTYARMYFDNNQADKMRIKKVVFTKADKSVLPNVAYVRPAGIVMDDSDAQEKLEQLYNPINPVIKDQQGNVSDRFVAPYWAWTNRAEMAKYKGYYDCGTLVITEQGLYDRTTFTQAAARDMVVYDATGVGFNRQDGRIPYGITADERNAVSTEYTFNFPGNGVELAGNYESNVALTKVGISIALPAFDGWNQMKVIVYADKWDGEKWVAGYISEKNGANGSVNANWNLQSLSLWDGDKQSDFGTVNLTIDDEYFTALNEIEVSSSKDFYNLVKGRLEDANTAVPVNLTVVPYGNDLVVGADVVKLIDDYSSKHSASKVNITFAGKEGVNFKNVVLEAENSIHKFAYDSINVVLKADQTITKELNSVLGDRGILNLTNKQGTLTVLNHIHGTKVVNENVMVIKTDIVNNYTISGLVDDLTNDGILTLNAGAVVTALVNEYTGVVNAEAGAGATVVTLSNKNEDPSCGDCAKGVINVTSGTLNVTTLNNFATVNVTSTLNVTTFNNNATGHNHGNGIVEAIVNNNGNIYTDVFTNEGTVNNYGKILSVANPAGTAKLLNKAVVNGYNGEIANLQNYGNGTLYVKSSDIHVSAYSFSDGKIVFEGVINKHVAKVTTRDERIFKTTADIKGSELERVMNLTAITHIWMCNNIILDWDSVTGESLWTSAKRAKLENLTVKANVSLKSEVEGKECNFKSTAFKVESNKKLTIDDALKTVVKSFSGSIDVTTGASFKDVSDKVPSVNHN